jgi:hypothetical protein
MRRAEGPEAGRLEAQLGYCKHFLLFWGGARFVGFLDRARLDNLGHLGVLRLLFWGIAIGLLDVRGLVCFLIRRFVFSLLVVLAFAVLAFFVLGGHTGHIRHLAVLICAILGVFDLDALFASGR